MSLNLFRINKVPRWNHYRLKYFFAMKVNENEAFPIGEGAELGLADVRQEGRGAAFREEAFCLYFNQL
jgi:hypothetical protein